MSAKDCCCFLHSILNKWRKRKMWENRRPETRDISAASAQILQIFEWDEWWVNYLFTFILKKIIKVTIKSLENWNKFLRSVLFQTVCRDLGGHDLESAAWSFGGQTVRDKNHRIPKRAAANTHLTVRAGPRRRWNNSSPCVSDRGRPIIAIWYLRSVGWLVGQRLLRTAAFLRSAAGGTFGHLCNNRSRDVGRPSKQALSWSVA